MTPNALLRFDGQLAKRATRRLDAGREDHPILLTKLPNELESLLEWLEWKPWELSPPQRKTLREKYRNMSRRSIIEIAARCPGLAGHLPPAFRTISEPPHAPIAYESVTATDQRKRELEKFKHYAWLVLATAQAVMHDLSEEIACVDRGELDSLGKEAAAEKAKRRREARLPRNRKGRRDRLPPNCDYNWLAPEHTRRGFKDATGRGESIIKIYTRDLGKQSDDRFTYTAREALIVLDRWLSKAGKNNSGRWAREIWETAAGKYTPGLKDLRSVLDPKFTQLPLPSTGLSSRFSFETTLDDPGSKLDLWGAFLGKTPVETPSTTQGNFPQ